MFRSLRTTYPDSQIYARVWKTEKTGHKMPFFINLRRQNDTVTAAYDRMERGIFQGTFYCPEGPEVVLEDMPIDLNPLETNLVEQVMASETLTRMELELAAVGNGLVWNKDHFEMLPDKGAEECQILMRHLNFLYPTDLENEDEVTKSNTFIYEMKNVFFSRFPNSMGRRAMYMLMERIKDELVPLVNTYYASCTPPIPLLTLDLSNNNENLPLGLVEHETDKWNIADMYRAGNPHPLTGVTPYRNDIVNVSKFLQTSRWPYCGQQNKCRKKTLVHRPDLALVHVEAVSVRPRNSIAYRVPLFIIEVEGAKDVWGSGEQEHKAMEEAAASLAFVPETYLLFIYHNRFEFWHLVRNPDDGSIDIKAYPVYVQQGSTIPFRDQMQKILVRIVKIMTKQCISGAEVLRLSEREYRRDGYFPYRDPRHGQGVVVCPNCWVLQFPLSATNHCINFAGDQARLPHLE